MRVIAISTLKNFREKAEHRDAEQALKAWLEEAQAANWQQPADIKARFRSASVLRKSLRRTPAFKHRSRRAIP